MRAAKIWEVALLLDRERWARTVTQQTLEPGSVMGPDGHARMEGKLAPMSPTAHFLGRLRVEETTALEQAEQLVTHASLNRGNVSLVQARRGMELQFPGGVLAQYPIDDTEVEVHVGIQRRAKALDERTEAPVSWCTRATLAQPSLECAERDREHAPYSLISSDPLLACVAVNR